jgi:two-component system, sensor histidine kinase
MDKPLPFFNWSLKKALDTESDSFIRARISIVFTILLFALLKVLIVIFFATINEQWRQLIRAVIGLVIYISLIKAMLYRPGTLNLLTHIMLMAGIALVWTNIFMFAHNVNLLTIQFVFMVILSSFYTQGLLFGIIYSAASVVPVLLSLLLYGNGGLYFDRTPQQFASPGFEIIAVLNFITITIAHYLFFQAFHDNIREKERLNQQLQLSVAEAQELAASKSNFLSTMSHELRTPLNSVIGITELLINDKPEERQKENLKILQFSALDLLSLINNVLDFNKSESGKLALEAVPFQLSQFMQNICAVLKVKANDKKLDFILDIDPQLKDLHLVSDPTRLSQVIYNLVSNAIKFTDKGSVAVKLQSVKKEEGKVEVLFTVQDTGVGIHPNRHDAIFDMFTQAESHITRKYGGSGLGLAIVKQVLTLFNSKIHLESTPGTGTVFSFAISFDVAENTSGNTSDYEGETQGITHLRILIAEDNDVNRLLLRKQMDNLGLQSIIVANGKLAYEACLSQQFDAVFMDLHMPVLDGYEATKQIRAITDKSKSEVYIIAFTASVTEQEKILETGFDDYLYKPVNMTDLREKLEQIAHRK